MGLLDLFRGLLVFGFLGVVCAAAIFGRKLRYKQKTKSAGCKTCAHGQRPQNYAIYANEEQKQLDERTKKAKCVFEEEYQFLDESDFWHHIKDIYFQSGESEIIRKTTTTIIDAHNAARSSQRVILCRVSPEELKEKMQQNRQKEKA